MSDVVPFSYENVQVRTVVVDGEVWFVATDVAKVLGIGSTNVSNMVKPLDEDERGNCQIITLGGQQQMITISESGLYRILMRSDKSEARKFQRWVTHDVLPQIRRTGRYELPAGKSEHLPIASFARADDALRQNQEAARVAVEFFTVLKDSLTEKTRQEVAEYLIKIPLGRTKAQAELEREITDAENVLIVKTYLKAQGATKAQVSRWSGYFGAKLHEAYRAAHGRSAPDKQKIMGAASRSGKLYTENDRWLFDQVYDQFAEAGKFPTRVRTKEEENE